MQVQNNSVVSIHYTLTDAQGAVLDSSIDHTPLAYIQGMGHIVPGLEKAMDGKKAGDKFKVSVPAEEGYGVRDEELIDRVPKEAFEGVPQVEPGMEFYADGPNGPVMITVKALDGDFVLVDGNHPLAGKELHFDIEVTEVREATAEESEHGHVHGEGGHHH
jgi:FKBP-type peptidyl-prolyl cis-trans isomerase SlyD